MAYATQQELTAWLGSDQALSADTLDVPRLLARASEAVDELVTAVWRRNQDGSAAHPKVAAALRNATCATVEYWLAAGGEAVDTVRLVGPVNFDGIGLGAAPGWHAPRAIRILRQAGLRGEVGAA